MAPVAVAVADALAQELEAVQALAVVVAVERLLELAVMALW